MRRIAALTLTILLASSAFAVAPQFWRVRSAEDFLGADLVEGFAVNSRGELRPAPAMKKVATFTDPFVLSQTAAPNGDRFFGTGNDGKIYRLRGTDLKVLWTAPEPEIYAVAFRDGALYAGSSPNGKVYRIDPESGTSAPFYDPKQAYIWSLAPLSGGDLAVATGVEGKLFRVTPKGEGKVLYDATDTHIRSVAARADGSLLAGSSGKGRIYEITAAGQARALYESALNEITSLYVDANGIGWASAASNVLPSAAPAKSAGAAKSGQQASGSGTADAKKDDSGTATAAVEVSFSFDDAASGTGSTSTAAGSAEVYRIDRDGFVETARKFDREMVYAISGASEGGILLATGPTGRIYRLEGNELSLVGAVPEKQIVSISTVGPSGGGSTLITTTNAGAVYRMENSVSTAPEFRSAAKDVDRFSRFGTYRIEGRDLGTGALAIAFRSGNTRTPDTTWSEWTAPQSTLEGSVPAPAARYLQWKLTMPKAAPAAAIDGVTVSYMNRNVAPTIELVAVQDPAVVFISSAYPSSPQVVEATNPDEYGIFASLDNPRDRSTPEQGKRVFRKGYRTVNWRATDDNGDTLRYDVFFRKKGSTQWLRLRENMEDAQLNFDTSQLPDALYELRVTATDAPDNPESPLTDAKEGVEFQVDNQAPSIQVTNSGNEVTVHITDALSPIGKVEYSIDADKWIRLTPVDGIADSRDETFRLPRTNVAGKFVIVRAVDGFYNVATESVEVK
ncbi:MAG: hypothetical protein QOH21_850 [Acidobacteriota bacterium]|nr:hypothetical protein [Acidobacteriota bacterium]